MICSACDGLTDYILELKEYRCFNNKCEWYCESPPFVGGNDTLYELTGGE